MQIKEIVDLGHDIYAGMPTLSAAHVGAGPVAFWPLETFEATRKLSGGKLGMEGKMVLMAEHTGTHLDAPSHFAEDGQSVDQISLDKLVLPGHFLDVRGKQAGEPISIADLEAAEERSGKPIGPGTAVIACTGFGTGETVWAREGFERDRPHFPVSSAEWLADKGITLFVTDVIGMDDPDEWWWPTHHVWLSRGIPMCQQVANLDKLEGKEFLFVVLPLKMRGGTASPVRPVALVL
ncbi:cyclase family protein [Mycobacterium kansasii]